MDIYKKHLQMLIDADLVYPCYCSEEELEEERQALILSKRMPGYMGKCRNLTEEERKKRENEGRKPSFRFKVKPQIIEFEDLIRGAMKFEGEAIGDFIIVRSNGMPAYNFAAVIDDHLMGITHVIRGEDHIIQYRIADNALPSFRFCTANLRASFIDSGKRPRQTQQTTWLCLCG